MIGGHENFMDKLPDLKKLKAEEKDALIIALWEYFQKEISKLEARIKELEAQLAKNSRNSSKPPSSDGFKREPKPKPKSQREKSHRKSGGQPGHKGNKLKVVENADEVIRHKVETCECCGRLLIDLPLESIERRQIFDIPPLSIYVTEHQVETKRCSCGKINKALFPEGLAQEAQYGPRIKSLMTYLNQYQLLPYDSSNSHFDAVILANARIHLIWGSLDTRLRGYDVK